MEHSRSSIIKYTTPLSENFIWVQSSKDLKGRIADYNSEIEIQKSNILKSRKGSYWKDDSVGNITVIWCNADDCMHEIDRFNQIKTVVLPWLITNQIDNLGRYCSLNDTQNLLVQNYYEWTGIEPLCSWINKPGFTKARYDAVYNRSCNADITKAFTVKSIEPVYFNSKPINPSDYWPNEGFSYPSYFYDHLPDRLLYLHLIQDGIITALGDVISRDVKIVPYSCSQDVTPYSPRNHDWVPIYSEVFVVTQHWGEAFFHKMIEVLPRIAPYLEFLINNKNVNIHVPEEHGYTKAALKFLGLGTTRFITGVARAKVVYLPQATPCGFGHVQELQLLSDIYRSKIAEIYQPIERDLVIFIRRSGYRQFSEQLEVERVVSSTAEKYGFKYVVLTDSPSPTMEMTMHMFAQAVMVVAPHGAGLSNVIYSDPGTIVIEGVCNPPHVNMCYQWTSHVLGHRYVGLASRGGCEGVIDIEPTMIEIAMTSMFEQLKIN